MQNKNPAIEVSVVMPCLNEEKTIGHCIKVAQQALKKLNLHGEIIVSNNGSTDNSANIAASLGAIVVNEPRRGYGYAYLKGLEAARGKYIITADSDQSYDLMEIDKLIAELSNGCDFVIGSRFKGNIKDGAMPDLHRLFGNPVMTWLVRFFFKINLSDAQSGMRGFTIEAYRMMDLRSTGFELATEFVVKPALLRMKISEVSITLHKDGRDRRPHLHSWSDGWRNLRFMLMYSPDYTFLIPGFFLLILGLSAIFVLLPGPLKFGNFQINYHFMIVGSVLSILGFQILNMGVFAKSYVFTEGLYTGDRWINKFLNGFSLERWLIIGFGIIFSSLLVVIFIMKQWVEQRSAIFAVRPAVLALTLLVIGTQIIFSSLIVSMFLIPKKQK